MAEAAKKTESLEKEMASMKTTLEDLQRTVRAGGGGRQAANGAGATSRHSTDVCCEVQVTKGRGDVGGGGGGGGGLGTGAIPHHTSTSHLNDV